MSRGEWASMVVWTGRFWREMFWFACMKGLGSYVDRILRLWAWEWACKSQ
jgi:hypothetical protein